MKEDKDHIETILAKVLTDQGTAEEIAQISEWCAQNDENQKVYGNYVDHLWRLPSCSLAYPRIEDFLVIPLATSPHEYIHYSMDLQYYYELLLCQLFALLRVCTGREVRGGIVILRCHWLVLVSKLIVVVIAIAAFCRAARAKFSRDFSFATQFDLGTGFIPERSSCSFG